MEETINSLKEFTPKNIFDAVVIAYVAFHLLSRILRSNSQNKSEIASVVGHTSQNANVDYKFGNFIERSIHKVFFISVIVFGLIFTRSCYPEVFDYPGIKYIVNFIPSIDSQFVEIK